MNIGQSTEKITRQRRIEQARWSFVKVELLASLFIIVLGVAVYVNSFDCPFIFDDVQSIQENPYVQSLWPPNRAMSAPPKTGVVGRPILSLSLALNYAVSGFGVWSYHAFNLVVHLLAALLVYGIIRRSLLSDRLRDKFGDSATPLACLIATVWMVHPIQTESVTYIIQRAESLMGLFYLLTLYTAIRAIQSQRAIGFSIASVICCALGMATKEVMVTAPMMVLLYDRMFGAGSFTLALRRRWGLYLGLAATWILLVVLVYTASRADTMGFATGISASDYAMNQCIVIVHYLKLCVWPVNLCLDYDWHLTNALYKILPSMLVVVAMISVTLWGLVRNRSFSYLGAWFFGILVPTSSFMPIADLVVEHRMYLSLAGFIGILVIAGYVFLEYIAGRIRGLTKAVVHRTGGFLILVILVTLSLLTIFRNWEYRSVESIWRTVVQRAPKNPRGYSNLGASLQLQDKLDEAVGYFHRTLELESTYLNAYYNLGLILSAKGRFDEAIEHFNKVLQLDAENFKAYNGLGNAFQSQSKFNEAVGFYEKALQLKPDYADAHYYLGNTLLEQGRIDEALWHFRSAVQSAPDYAEAHYNLALVLQSQRKFEEAIGHYRQALRVSPDNAEAHNNLANTLASKGKLAEAIGHYRKALKIKPDHANTHNNLANALASGGKLNEAIEHYRQALQANPNHVPALNSLALSLIRQPADQLRDSNSAVTLAERAAELTNYQNPIILDTLAAAYAEANRFGQATKTAQRALELALAAGNTQLANHIREQIKIYDQAKP